MAWICGRLRVFGSVAVVMARAAGGTIGIIKVIQKVFHGYPQPPVSPQTEDAEQKSE